jgi:uncharacterized cupredoxin-like copper-binding protein
MIRFFVLTGIVGGALVAYLTTLGVGPVGQLPPSESLLTGFRAEGKLPENKSLAIDETAEELEVFEVPDQDVANLEVAEAAYEKMMGGMDMSGGGTMNMGDGNGTGMNMAADGDGSTASGSMNMGDGNGSGMNMAADGDGATASGSMNMGDGNGSGMNMAADGDGTAASGSMNMAANDDGSTTSGNMNMGDGNGSSMNMAANDDGSTASGNMNMGDGNGEAMSPSNKAMMGEGGLLVSEDGNFDREITLTMAEWKFSEMSIDVKMGERIKFTVKNGGQIPHEFMFMSPPLMNAVTYRATRADWNLYEHEALFEQALVLPGGEFTFVLTVTEPGAWMFMCMLPYHMQLGMMGQMATDGMAMDM